MSDPAAPDPARREAAKRELKRRFTAGWSTRLAVKAAITVFVLVQLVNGVVMVFNPGWRTHVTFGTERRSVEVVEVQADAVSCGRYVSGDRLVVTWSEDGVAKQGTLECQGSPEVGDRVTAYPVDGERGYEWPSYEFWVFTAVVSVLGGIAIALLRAVLRGFGKDT